LRNRRSFFARCLAIAAVVALAPEIAFGRKLRVSQDINLGFAPYWKQSTVAFTCMSPAYLEWRNTVLNGTAIQFCAEESM